MSADLPALRRRRRTGPPLKFRVPRWAGREAADPFGAVLRLHQSSRTLLLASAIALGIYGAAVGFTLSAREPPPPAPEPRRVEVPVIVAAPPPVAPPEPAAKPPPPVHARRAPSKPAPPAQAAQVVTQAPTPAAGPVDFSDFALATGHGDSYAGGYTSSNGTNRTAAAERPVAARASAPRPAAGSQARAAAPARLDWTCTWPDEAQAGELRETRVVVQVKISPDGEPTDVAVQGTPLPGFSAAARTCALGEQYRPALDAQGQRIAGQTGLLVVHFVR